MADLKLSVLLPIYYKELPDHFRMALDSLEKQSLQADEIVIVKDGPLTIALESVISDYADRLPIKCIALPKNVGLGEALHTGLMECKNEYVARMDSDDLSLPDRFKKQADFLINNPDVDILGGYLKEFSSVVGDLDIVRKVPLTNQAIHNYTYYRSPFNHPTVMFKKSAVLRAGSYKRMPYFEDYYLWIRMAYHKCVFHNLDEVLLNYRIGNNMIARRHGYQYAMNEFRFFKLCYEDGLISKTNLMRFLIRFPIRLVPQFVLSKIYANILR